MNLNSRLVDTFNRRLNYLRVSVTDRCNLKCLYCVPAQPSEKLMHREVLRYEEMLRIIRIGASLGITKVRVTGGEPLVRKGIYSFLEELNQIEGIKDVSLTTNGVQLKNNLKRIKETGIKRLNISLDTLDRKKYQSITGSDQFNEVWEGILLALEMGFHPVKINAVALNGINDDEIENLAALSLTYPLHIRFIEYMPIGISGLTRENCLPADAILNRISRLGKLNPVATGFNDGPAERLRIEGAPGEIGIIRPLTHHFCDKCNRLRLTASGQLRPCLLSDRQFDIKTPLRKGYLDGELIKVFMAATQAKPSEHHMKPQDHDKVSGQMSSIGG